MKRQYTSTERIGINAVEQVILRFGWLFREQPITDFGIDALVEMCENGKPNGRLIALQIKSGESYFKEHSAAGFVYRGSKRHLEYWVGHSLPVFLVLYHPGRNEAWWCVITSEAITHTSKGWRITVPTDQKLEEASRSRIAAYATLDFRNRKPLADLQATFGQGARLSSVLDALAMAQQEIDVASSYIDEQFFWTLSAIARRRIRVRLVTGPHLAQRLWDEAHSPDHVQLEWRTSLGFHDKVIAIDRRIVIYGSANFTAFSWRRSREIALASCETEILSKTRAAFETLWSGGNTLSLTMPHRM